MEASVLSPSASAETADTIRLDWARIKARTSGGMAGGQDISFNNVTFCQCCGSQIVNEKGQVTTAAGPVEIVKSREIAEKHYAKLYGPDVKSRFSGRDYENMLRTHDRRDRPGVTMAFMKLDEVLPLLYSEEKLKLADGYEINDKDHKHPITVVWLNA